jgi:hypothetical protein
MGTGLGILRIYCRGCGVFRCAVPRFVETGAEHPGPSRAVGEPPPLHAVRRPFRLLVVSVFARAGGTREVRGVAGPSLGVGCSAFYGRKSRRDASGTLDLLDF